MHLRTKLLKNGVERVCVHKLTRFIHSDCSNRMAGSHLKLSLLSFFFEGR